MADEAGLQHQRLTPGHPCTNALARRWWGRAQRFPGWLVPRLKRRLGL